MDVAKDGNLPKNRTNSSECMENKLTSDEVSPTLTAWAKGMLEENALFNTPPISASSLSSLMNDSEEQDLDETVEMISQDRLATKRILGWANSAISGAVEPITDLKTAIMRVGVGPMAQITVISRFQSFLTRDLDFYRISGHDFWKHSIATAIATESIGRMITFPLPSECFTAGLLHDLGKFMIDAYATNFSIPAIEDNEDASPKSHYEIEMERFQTHHA